MDRSFTSKFLFASAILLIVGGCGSRHFSSRSTNPLIEDRVRMGDSGEQKMSVLTSRADRRTILVFGEKKICAEPSPDVAEAVYSQTAASVAQKETKAEFSATLQTALMQLSRRSQGLDFYRTGAFVNCMMYYNGVFKDKAEYAAEMAKLRETSIALTEKELAHLPEVMKAVVQVSHAAAAAATVATAEKDKQPAVAGATNKK